MSGETLQVFVAVYDDEDGARAAAKDFKLADREGTIELFDAAVVVHRAGGKVDVSETADPSGRTWAKRGAVAGALVGLIFPPSLIGTAVVGAAGGGIWGRVRDKGFKDDDLRAIGDHMEPGTSALIVISEDRVIERLARDLEGYERIARHALSAEAAAMIQAEIEAPAAEKSSG